MEQPFYSVAERRILLAIASGAVSQSALVKSLRLTPATISQQISKMVGSGLLKEEAGKATTGRGRPRLRLRLNPNAFVTAGLDFGAGHVRGVLLSADGKALRWRETARVWTDAREALQAADVILKDLREALPNTVPLVALGIADPGTVDVVSGTSVGAVNIAGWRNLHLREWFAYSAPRIIIRSSAQMKCHAEILHGGLEGVRNGLYVDLGLGVGAALLLDGRVFGGDRGLAGELGHVCVNPDGVACSCGGYGCLETECSGRALALRAERILGADGRPWDALKAAVAAKSGNLKARAIFERAGCLLGRALAGACNLLSPERIVLGGGLSGAADLLLHPALRVMTDQALDPARPYPEIEVSPLDASEAGAFGAALAAMVDFLEIHPPSRRERPGQ